MMTTTQETDPQTVAPGREGTTTPRPRRSRRVTSLVARGEPMVWLTGGCVAAAVLMIVTLLGFITWQGFTTFWPRPLVQIRTTSNEQIMGEPTRSNVYIHSQADASGAMVRQEIARTLYKTGNYDLSGEDFRWVEDRHIAERSRPMWGFVIERTAWGNAYGVIEEVIHHNQRFVGPEAAWAKFQQLHGSIRRIVGEIHEIEREQIGPISHRMNDLRLELRKIELRHGRESEQYRQAADEAGARQEQLQAELDVLRGRVQRLRTELATARVVFRTADGKMIPEDRSRPDVPMQIAQVVRAYPANQLDFGDKLGVYLSRWWEYLADEPREANTEGGVFPAIFGTVLMTFIMILFVVPIGVIAAIYLREYARQGLVVSIVRISVNNLAGVPSIVFGVFGLGFFCYLIGGSIDQMFFPERLPDPTVGKSAILWASLTLALLTLPVVIVATEEALAAVPRSMREGSYACGASKWQTIRRIVLPRAMPGIMTGTILAVARGAGEVAPLMLVGAVKLAPELPISADPSELFGINRSFMHLGFHIYDLGFQSRNSEAAKPMVYTTTFLLIGIVVFLNLAAMFVRGRLRKAHAGGHF